MPQEVEPKIHSERADIDMALMYATHRDGETSDDEI